MTKQVQQLSFSPSIWFVEDFLTDEQCRDIIKLAEGRLERSKTVNPETGEDMIISQRSSEQIFIQFNHNRLITEIEQGIADLVEMPMENGEPFQILRYSLNQEYEPHYDYFNEDDGGSAVHLARGGQRVATILLYLSEPEEGGETVFPKINLSVKPKKGAALIFYSLFDNGMPDPNTLHGSLPVKRGEKWVATKWMRQNKFLVNPPQPQPPAEHPEGDISECPWHQRQLAMQAEAKANLKPQASPQGPETVPGHHAEPPSAGAAESEEDERYYVPLNNTSQEPEQSDAPQPERPSARMDGEAAVKVWRLHPNGVRIEAADKTLMGDAPSGAVRWCGPFTHANAYGFWLYSPVDIDITWHGGRTFEYEVINGYSDEDFHFLRSLQKPDDKYQYEPRMKIDAGGVFEGIFSIWTGCAFKTPPGWALMIRSVINKPTSPLYKIQEGILETDWLPYDIWMNLLFLQQGKKLSLRRNSHMPVAQIIPVPREAYDRKWELIQSPMERNTPEGEAFYQEWMNYNYKKWVENARKEPYTYHAERARNLKKSRHEME